jgi:hypothetical protein
MVGVVGNERPVAEVDPEADASSTEGPAGSTSGLTLASAVGFVLAVVGFAVGSRTIGDNSFLTHLATGNLILETRAVPRVDPYSLLAAGESWTVQSWLVSFVYASLDVTLGGWSIRVLHGLAGMAIVWGMWRLVSPADQLVTRVLLVGTTVLVGTFLWPPRPLLVGLVATVVLLQVIQGQRPPWWLVPVFWVWVNSHGSFVLGGGLIGAVMVGAAIDERRIPRAEVRLLAIAGIGCLLGAINPLGPRLLWFPLHLMSRREALDGVAEWTSPTFRSPVELLYLSLLGLIVLAASRGAPWRAVLPSIVFFAAGLTAVRNLGLASLVVIALLAPSLRGLVGTVDGSLRGAMPRMVAAVGSALLVVLTATVATTSPIDVDDYPVAEIRWLDDRDLVAASDVRLAQRDLVGNYLTLRYGAEANAFMDDRFDFHPLQVITDHNDLLLGGDAGEVVDRNGFDVMLWAKPSPLRRWVDTAPDWDVVLDGDKWFVACRTTSAVYPRCG